MDITIEVERHHIEKAADIILVARKTGFNEKLAVQEYCVQHRVTCMPDVFCLAMGLVERKKILSFSFGDNRLR